MKNVYKMVILRSSASTKQELVCGSTVLSIHFKGPHHGNYKCVYVCQSEEELKKPLDESESGEWKTWLKAQHSENEDHGIRSHHFMAIGGETVADFILGGSKSLQMVIAAMKLKDTYSLKEKLWPT